MYYVYVLQADDNPDKTYLGYSSDLRKRLNDHNASKNTSTNNSQWKLIYYEAYILEKTARLREQSLKRNPRMKKLLWQRIFQDKKAEE